MATRAETFFTTRIRCCYSIRVRPLVVRPVPVSDHFTLRYRKCSRQPAAWRPPMSPNSRGKNKKRARSVEGLLETTAAEPEVQVPQTQQMKKAKSLEEYLDKCEEDPEDGNSVSASISDSVKKRNFVDKCINKMKSLMTSAKRTTDADSKQ